MLVIYTELYICVRVLGRTLLDMRQSWAPSLGFAAPIGTTLPRTLIDFSFTYGTLKQEIRAVTLSEADPIAGIGVIDA